MSYGYIYKCTLKPTNKIYIGKRAKSEFDYAYFGSGKLWRKMLDKYDKNADINREVLEWCDSLDELNDREVYWISKYDSRNPDIGYNVSMGGTLGFTGCTCKHSEESKNKIREKLTGYKHSDESKLHMSEGQKKYWKKHHSKDRIDIALSGIREFYKNNPDAYKTRSISVKCVELNKIYNSIKDAQEDLKIYNISDCLNGFIDTAGNYHWEIVGESNNKYSNYDWHRRKVLCVETGEIFNSIKEATYSKKAGHIADVCNKNRHTSGGYHWEWVIN